MNESLRKMRLNYCNDHIKNLPAPIVSWNINEFLTTYLALEDALTQNLLNEDPDKPFSHLFTEYFELNYSYRLGLILGLFYNEKQNIEICGMIEKLESRTLHHYADENDLAANMIKLNNSRKLDARCRYLAKEIHLVHLNILTQICKDRKAYMHQIQKHCALSDNL